MHSVTKLAVRLLNLRACPSTLSPPVNPKHQHVQTLTKADVA